MRAASVLRDEDVLSTVKFDVVDGVAGCLLALAALYRAISAARVLRLAEKCGERLLSAQLRYGPHRGGFPPNDGGAPMAGFSHGPRGIACSLCRLYETSGDVRFRNAAWEAFSSERSALGISMSLTDAQHTINKRGERLVSWCHGAPGTALARLDALSAVYSEALELEAEVAIGITESYGLRTLDSLCCGNLGRMETLLVASSMPGRKRFERLAESWTATVVGRARESYYRLRSNAHSGKVFFNPPLFHGMAGVGYQLLRVAKPTDIPVCFSGGNLLPRLPRSRLGINVCCLFLSSAITPSCNPCRICPLVFVMQAATNRFGSDARS